VTEKLEIEEYGFGSEKSGEKVQDSQTRQQNGMTVDLRGEGTV
jgi:hypothetical protein